MLFQHPKRNALANYIHHALSLFVLLKIFRALSIKLILKSLKGALGPFSQKHIPAGREVNLLLESDPQGISQNNGYTHPYTTYPHKTASQLRRCRCKIIWNMSRDSYMGQEFQSIPRIHRSVENGKIINYTWEPALLLLLLWSTWLITKRFFFSLHLQM